MAILVAQARFTHGGLGGMIAAPDDRAEAVGRLIAEVGGEVVAYFFTSGDYDILLIFEVPSYEDAVPALVVAAAESGLSDLKTAMALDANEMKSAFVRVGTIAPNYRSPGERPAGPSAPGTDRPNSEPERERSAGEAEDGVKAATSMLDARKKAVEDIQAGRPAPYYFAPPTAPARSK
jgi:uncharacterized protein with GYD domain